jgi:(p)ppGpp synthase/HD superfamily hydrolase
LAVAALVIENGRHEDQAIAALLHDAPEDQGGRATLEEIRRLFGARVAEIVEGCTDTFETPKPLWKPRKQAYLEHLGHASDDVRLVSMADKLHNARSILVDLETVGGEVWERFTGGRDGTLWYYRSLVDVYRKTDPESPLTNELRWVLDRIEKLSGCG